MVTQAFDGDLGAFEVSSVTGVVFTPSLAEFHTARVTGHLINALPHLSGDPLVLPIPPSVIVPNDFTRVVLRDPAGDRTLQIAAGRTEYRLGGQAVRDGIESLVETLERVLGHLAVRPGRIAFIVTRSGPVGNPAERLVRRFLAPRWSQGGPFVASEGFEVHAYRRVVVAQEAAVNYWIRLRSSVSIPFDGSGAVTCEQDINTNQLVAEDRSFSEDEIREFLREAERTASDDFNVLVGP